MFGPLGVPELIFIFVLALLIFGPRRLPEIGRTVGKAIGEFRRATTDLKRSINTEIALEEEQESDRERTRRLPRRDVETPAAQRELPAPPPGGTVAQGGEAGGEAGDGEEAGDSEDAGEGAGSADADAAVGEDEAEGTAVGEPRS